MILETLEIEGAKMDKIYIRSIAEYLDKLEELGEEYPSISTNPIVNNFQDAIFLFRGMEDYEYKLIPSVYRTIKDPNNDFEISNRKYTTFSSERNLLQNFIQDASAYAPQFNVKNYVRWAELAQHYGVPTRFLDWTENPLVALYFACESNKDSDAVVWVLHKRNYAEYAKVHDENRFKYDNQHMTNEEAIQKLLTTSPLDDCYSQLWKLPIIYTPYYFDHRMSAQASWFMVWGNKKEPLEDLIENSSYMKFEPPTDGIRSYGKDQEERFMFRFFIHQSDKQYILRRLDHVGIHAKSLFPGLDGIGQRIERVHRLDYNEFFRSAF